MTHLGQGLIEEPCSAYINAAPQVLLALVPFQGYNT
jgi:hypothetical protein